MAYSEAQGRASMKYEAENLKNIVFHFNIHEDGDILDSLEEAKQHGITRRQWIRAYFEAKPEVPNDLVSKSKVEQLLWDFRIDPDVIRNIMGEI